MCQRGPRPSRKINLSGSQQIADDELLDVACTSSCTNFSEEQAKDTDSLEKDRIYPEIRNGPRARFIQAKGTRDPIIVQGSGAPLCGPSNVE